MAQWYQGQKLPLPRLAEDHQEELSEEAERDRVANQARRGDAVRDTRPWWKRLLGRRPAAG